MKKWAILALPVALALVFAFTGCGKQAGGGASSGDTVDMTAATFVQSSLKVKSGTAVKFVDPASGSMHIICTGEQGTCSNDTNAPKDVQGNGFTINTGETKTVTFDNPGTYKITCSIHPAMNLTLTVE